MANFSEPMPIPTDHNFFFSKNSDYLWGEKK